jgi:hypothetical protein
MLTWLEKISAPTNPTTGVDGCCARPASGQAAAPPTNVMNSRRLIAFPKTQGKASNWLRIAG